MGGGGTFNHFRYLIPFLMTGNSKQFPLFSCCWMVCYEEENDVNIKTLKYLQIIIFQKNKDKTRPIPPPHPSSSSIHPLSSSIVFSSSILHPQSSILLPQFLPSEDFLQITPKYVQKREQMMCIMALQHVSGCSICTWSYASQVLNIQSLASIVNKT